MNIVWIVRQGLILIWQAESDFLISTNLITDQEKLLIELHLCD